MATANTVTIACKLPNGMFLDLMGEEKEEMVPSNSGPVRQVKRDLLKRVLVRGVAAERRLERGDEHGDPMESPGIMTVQGGYGLTFGVDKDFWDAWLRQNANSDLVKNRLIFAAAGDKAADQAREQEEIRSGLEPLDPEKLPKGLERVKRAA